MRMGKRADLHPAANSGNHVSNPALIRIYADRMRFVFSRDMVMFEASVFNLISQIKPFHQGIKNCSFRKSRIPALYGFTVPARDRTIIEGKQFWGSGKTDICQTLIP